MNILSVGTEQKLFDQESRVYKRIYEYRFFAETYYSFVFTKNQSAKKIVDKNFIVIPVYGRNKVQQITCLFKLLRDTDIKKEGLIVSSQDPFEIGLISSVVAKRYNAKLLVQMHSDISTDDYKKESFRNMVQSYIARYVLSRADRVRVVSGRMRTFLVEKLKIKEDKVILLPIFSVLNNEHTYVEKKTNKILMLCRIEEVKQIPLAIESVEILRERSGLDYTLKIVGEGSQKSRLQEKYRQLSWVVWSPFVEDVRGEYQSSSLLLITSRYEGFAMTAVESVSFGIPVAMTDVGCAGDVIKEGVNGGIAKQSTKESIADVISRTLEYNFTPEDLIASLKILGTKDEYLEKMKQLHTF